MAKQKNVAAQVEANVVASEDEARRVQTERRLSRIEESIEFLVVREKYRSQTSPTPGDFDRGFSRGVGMAADIAFAAAVTEAAKKGVDVHAVVRSMAIELQLATIARDVAELKRK